MTADSVVFSASRMKLAGRVALALLMFGCGGVLLWFRLTGSRGGMGPLFDIEHAREVIGIVGCIGLCMVALLALPLIVDPRMVFIDDEGIRVRYSIGSRRARWADFRGATTKTVRKTIFQILVFSTAAGGDLTVTVPAAVDTAQVMAEVQRRLTLLAGRPAHRPAPPSVAGQFRGFGRRVAR